MYVHRCVRLVRFVSLTELSLSLSLSLSLAAAAQIRDHLRDQREVRRAAGGLLRLRRGGREPDGASKPRQAPDEAAGAADAPRRRECAVEADAVSRGIAKA